MLKKNLSPILARRNLGYMQNIILDMQVLLIIGVYVLFICCIDVSIIGYVNLDYGGCSKSRKFMGGAISYFVIDRVPFLLVKNPVVNL